MSCCSRWASADASTPPTSSRSRSPPSSRPSRWIIPSIWAIPSPRSRGEGRHLQAGRALRHRACRSTRSPWRCWSGRPRAPARSDGRRAGFPRPRGAGRLVYQDEDGLLDLPLPRLPGRHQHVNAGTAIAALRAAGFGRLPAKAFETGISGRTGRPGCSGSRAAGCRGAPARTARNSGSTAAIIPMAERPSPPPWGLRGTPRRARWSWSSACSAPRIRAGFLEPFRRNGAGGHGRSHAKPDGCAPGRGSRRDRRARPACRPRPASSIEDALAAFGSVNGKQPPRVLICGSLYLAGEVLAANGTPPTLRHDTRPEKSPARVGAGPWPCSSMMPGSDAG